MATLEQLTGAHSELINTIARQNGFTDDFQVDISSGSGKGDNFLGVITKVTIKSKERKLEVILKTASTSEAFRQAVPVKNAYSRELYIYETIFVEFKKFQDEFHVSNPFTGHPKLYGTSSVDGQEFLVMENLLASGYQLWNRKIPMNAEHIKAVFVEYAKFHSISLAMAHKKPELFNDLTRDIQEHVFQASFDNTEKITVIIKSLIESVSKGFEDDPKTLQVLKKFASVMLEYFSKGIKSTEWNLVVNHGDNWCNNLMFKYEAPETTKKISKVSIIDWQLAKKGSPAADITYFFLAHSPKEVLYDYKNYLKIYYDTVCKSLRDFSCDPEEVFPYSLLEQHWREFINFALYRSMMAIRMMYSETDEAPDLDNLSDTFNSDFKNSIGYYQRLKDLMKFVIDTELISL